MAPENEFLPTYGSAIVGLVTSPCEAPAMSLQRIRFTVRSMMVAVAAMAVAIEGWQLLMWSRTYSWMASQASASEAAYTQAISEGRDVGGCLPDPPGQPPPSPSRVAQMRRWAAHYGRVKRMYRYAATHPWIAPPAYKALTK